MLKKGTLVTIYEDPLTRIKPQGEARIIKHVMDLESGVGLYKVRFVNDAYDRPVMRSIVELVATEKCSCREQPGDDPDCKVHARQIW